ncbi:MAG: putative pyridoxine 5'-phosphate oxidase superfamily flavin-nucleotide-binding protein [Halocynthiibacter sp.]|jgi:predicted pyridoxine 5'-phosphate oxidase superfamily flavin-nucleotide-binding protein
MSGFYHEGMRAQQDATQGRAVADRLEEHRMHRSFSEADIAMIQAAPFFFLSTASETSTDCSFKGGMPGFVRVTGANTLEWPDYDGNRMYRSLGNIALNPRVGLLFIRFDGNFDGLAARMRINGQAEIIAGDPRHISVTADHIFPNCPRYIPQMALTSPSEHAPREGHTAPTPEWKTMPWVSDIFEEEERGKP